VIERNSENILQVNYEIKFLNSSDAVSAAHKNAYRISRSNSNRKKKESYDFNYDYDSGNQAAHDLGGNEDVYGTEHIPVHHGHGGGGKNGYSEGSGKFRNVLNLSEFLSVSFFKLFLTIWFHFHFLKC
jgi:uncharacterized sporulation protein YeaH/YhbH (DUF444 family)